MLHILTGLGCVRLIRVISMDPHYVKCEDIQAIFRIRRMSQQSPYTYVFRLLNRRSRIENSFAVVQAKEGGFAEINNDEYSILLTYVL